MSYDLLLQKTGEFGLFQRRICIVLGFVAFPSVFHSMGYVFFSAKMNHWCEVYVPGELKNLTITPSEWRNRSAPRDRADEWERQCTRYDRNYSDVGVLLINNNLTLDQLTTWFSATNQSERLVECNQWAYDRSEYTSTIVSQFDLVCRSKWLRSVTQAVYMAGLTVATILFGLLSDRFGRRIVILISIVLVVVSGTSVAFAPDLYSYMVLRFFLALGCSGAWETGYVLLVEIVGPSWRVFVGTMAMLYWAMAYLILALLAYLIRNHVTLQLVTTVPFVLMAGYYWFIPESPRWLLSKGRQKEAKTIILKMTHRNATNVPCDVIEDSFKTSLHKVGVQVDKAQGLSMMRSSYIWKWSAVLLFIWFTNSLVYYGLSLNTSSLGGNPYINFFISGAVEIPAYILCVPMLNYLGRRWSMMVTMILAGVTLLASLYIPAGMFYLSISLAMLGKFAITCSFSMIYVYTAELFPTTVRNLGVGYCNMMSRIAGIIAPFSSDISVLYPSLPLIIFGVMSTVSGLLIFILPETKGHKLPQTIAEGRLMNETYSVFKRCRKSSVPGLPEETISLKLNAKDDCKPIDIAALNNIPTGFPPSSKLLQE